MARMKRITREEERSVTWENDVPEFENPDVLIYYLQLYAPRGSHRVRGYEVWATDEAIQAAIRGLKEEVTEDDRRQWL